MEWKAMKKRGKAFLGLLLCAALMIGLAPGTLRPAMADGGKTIYGLGTAGISNPAIRQGGWSQVYFSSNSTPILFNVLKNGETNFGGNTLLPLSSPSWERAGRTLLYHLLIIPMASSNVTDSTSSSQTSSL